MTPDGKVSVLLVDDDAQVRLVVALHLRQLGFAVTTAHDGSQALEALDNYVDLDVILLDLLMPVMDGYDFLAAYSGPVPVIVMSGLGDVAKLPRQPFALVVKPMSMVDVSSTLREAAAHYRTAPREGDETK